ncbi:MAG: hypothetical protein ACK4OO_05140 [bacterium]
MTSWWIPFLVGSVGVPVLAGLAARFFPRRQVYMFAWRLGRRLASWGSIYATKEGWEKLHRSVWTILYDLADGLRDGSRLADKPLPTPPLH